MVVRVEPPGSEADARENIAADRGVLARYVSTRAFVMRR
jgi:hypothetical protein